jgi:hypothetical protein
MLRHKLIRVNAFILIILLLFSVSAYDTSVYAKMQLMEDDSLAQIDAETGVTLNLNLTVRSAAYSVFIANGSTFNDSINFGLVGASSNSVFIGDGTGTGSFNVSTDVEIDVGSLSGQTYQRQRITSGLPSSSAGIGILINDLNANVNGVNRWLGNLQMTGIFIGQNVSAVNGVNITPALAGASGMETRMKAHSSGTGIDMWMSQAQYIDRFAWNVDSSGARVFSVSGIYMYAANTTIPSGTPSSWGTLTGNYQVGYNGTSLDYAQIDIGSNGSANGTILRISAPQYGSQRIRSIALPGLDFGPSANDNQQLMRFILTIRNLNSSGY